MTSDPAPVWSPPASLAEGSRLTAFTKWLERERGLGPFAGYAELWRWSVDDLEGFWRAVWDYFEIEADGDPEPVLASRAMPGAEWFPNVALNYAEHVFRGRDEAAPAILHASELGGLEQLSWGELRVQTAAMAAWLRAQGVGRGDRVVGFMPNVPATVVAFLASASLGAIWSSCSPDFGAGSVVDRFAQIRPKVLFAVDGYRYGGRDFSRAETVRALREALPSLERTVFYRHLGGIDPPDGAVEWDDALAAGAGSELTFERVPFDHSLWVLYSSGTTGLPKAIVQGHGGITIEHLKVLSLHLDLGPASRFFWFTTTGWMMWNYLVSGLLTGASIVLYDGNPGYPDLGTLWQLAADAGITSLGTSAAFLASCMKAGIEPAAGRDLSALGALGSTGSPLAPEGFDWVYEQLGTDIWLSSASGGTDVCTAFVGGVPTLPVYRGELQAPVLGVALEAWDEDGRPLVGEVGELVVTEPMPSMPTKLWGDDDGFRYRESYFEMYPGVWRHGDWLELTEHGTAVIHGRSDSTINRGGIRMGSAEIYRAVLAIDEVVDALVVDLPKPGTDGWIELFVVMREGSELSAEMTAEITRRIRTDCSPRHVPDEVRAIVEVPRTLTGKALEVPVKRILTGADPASVVSRDALANPDALDFFVRLAASDLD
jgi:acetoacetyl-CoA synthetase